MRAEINERGESWAHKAKSPFFAATADRTLNERNVAQTERLGAKGTQLETLQKPKRW